MNNKFSIGVVIAIVLQVSGFVWWIAQQSQTIDTLKTEVSELTAKAEIEKQVQLKADVAQLRKELDKMKQDILESLTSIDDARVSEDNRLGQHVDERINGLGSYVDERLQEITNNIIAEFKKHEEWIDELDYYDVELEQKLEKLVQDLDKKLSDRIKELTEK
jgi:hypothetical protein